MAIEDDVPADDTAQPSLLDRVRAKRASRQDADAAARAAWLEERAADERAELERSAAAKRVRAAAHAGIAADPADVALALGSNDVVSR
jgi:non-homologous end joining protein Ku